MNSKLSQANRVRRRLKALREDRGAGLETMAAVAGLRFESYRDSESCDDEIFGNISINRLTKICNFLDLRLFQLVGGVQATRPTISLNQLALMIKTKIADSTQKTVEDAVGWDLKDFVRKPKVALEYPLDFIRDMCKVLKISWLTAIPN